MLPPSTVVLRLLHSGHGTADPPRMEVTPVLRFVDISMTIGGFVSATVYSFGLPGPTMGRVTSGWSGLMIGPEPTGFGPVSGASDAPGRPFVCS